MSRRRWIGVALLASLVAIGVAVWHFGRGPRLNLIVITLDTTRADRIGCYGYPQALTPVLDRLAARGVVLEQAYCPVPLTLPSHASLFTGLYPPEHGLRTNGKNRLDDALPTLAEACRAAGYETGAFIASFVLDSKFGLDRGFETYGDDLTGTAPADEPLHRHREGRLVVDEALRWLEQRTQRTFFCWVHLYDPHAPYLERRDQFGERFHESPYDAGIAYVDVQVGRLLEFVRTQGLEQQTLVVVVGDHGEGLNEHHERRHGQMLYNSTLRVPWIMALPERLPAGRRIATPVSLVDFYPTVHEALGLSGSVQTSGRSLWGTARGETLESRPLYAETDEPFLESGWSPLRSLISDNWKYIRTPQAELYDLQDDPQESKNLVTADPERLQEFDLQLTELESRFRPHAGESVTLSSSEREKLAGLGYLGHAGGKGAPAGAELHDIKEMIQAYNRLEDARELLEAGRFDEAAEQLQAIVKDAPDYDLAELSLGDVFLRQQKLDDAWEVYQRVAQRNPESALAVLHLGDVREAQGRFDEALKFYQAALKREPDFARLHYNIGRLLILLQRNDEAPGYFRKAIELDPGFVFAHIELGSALSRAGLLDAALAEYQLALKYDARSVFAHMNAAMTLARQRRPSEALVHLEQASRIAPQDPEIQFQLGAFLAQQGQFDSARPHLEETLRLQPNHAGARVLLEELRSR